ncbi:MAG: hypothetical protein MZV63_46320 [Marinilabiliales bacterium]|nr:hypothetical protein [Marinilabiliales bacterium]
MPFRNIISRADPFEKDAALRVQKDLVGYGREVIRLLRKHAAVSIDEFPRCFEVCQRTADLGYSGNTGRDIRQVEVDPFDVVVSLGFPDVFDDLIKAVDLLRPA